MGGYVTINPTPAGDITGSGTTNYLAMFTSTNSVGDSVIYQSGSKVYFSAANTFIVNTATPSFSVGYDSQTITIAGVSYLSTQSSYINVGTSVNHQSMAASATASVSSVQIGARSRGTFAAPTAVQSGDSIYSFYSVGHDGTDYAIATAIEHIVGGTVGANQVPGKIKFSTANSSGTLTEAMSIYSTQQVNIGNYTTPSAQRLVTIGQDTAWLSFGSLVGATSFAAIYMNIVSPTIGNSALYSPGSGLTTLNASTKIYLNINAIERFSVEGLVTSGNSTSFTFTVPANTGQTASTEIPNFKLTGNTKTWANGGGATTIATQRWNYFTANTAATSGGGSLTITDSFGLYAEAATASGVTITNSWAAGFSGNVKVFNDNASTKLVSRTNLSSGISTNASITAENDSLYYARIVVYGPNHGITEYRNNGALGFHQSGYILSNGEVSTGGTQSLYFLTGGYTPSTQTRLTIDSKGNTVQGLAALATNATDGFLYIETCAGTPTGVPTTYTGRIAMVYDTTNNKLYMYNGAWKSVTLA